MKFVEDNDFNEMIENFKKLSVVEKKQLTIKEIKNLLAVLYALNSQNDSDSKILFNREIFSFNEEDCSEEDFVEATYAYIYSIKESLADLLTTFVDS